MSKENVLKFISLMKYNDKLANKTRHMPVSKIVKLAKKMGYNFSEEEFSDLTGHKEKEDWRIDFFFTCYNAFSPLMVTLYLLKALDNLINNNPYSFLVNIFICFIIIICPYILKLLIHLYKYIS
ncbi:MULTISPECIES: Nif11-like leader peptide family natural product precursor [Calothrix]|uniref:Nif11 family protein n=2 Tax=Calothrix TaxID=1186 RepID=A0ABR8ALP5_9CYAN|nr:Nif11 family protein [Calothrix parietina FACHB-288]MBD2229120.1 Nif11 family protein [Calothrix anomala FACHB-343]